MEISVRVLDSHEPGLRWHFCTARQQDIGVQVTGAYRDARVFCPLCGGLTTSDVEDVRPSPGWIDRERNFGCPDCPHGYPDAPCSELSATNADCDYEFRLSVPEYRALRLSSEPDRFKALERWARPCALCREQILADNYGVLEHELRQLCAELVGASAAAQDRVRDFDSALRLVHALRERVDRHENTLRAEAGDLQLGYLYGISNGHAIKIGWSWAHPGARGGRLAQLQTGCPDELRLLGAILGAKSEERALHARFYEHRIRGEWFRHAPEIVEYFVKQ